MSETRCAFREGGPGKNQCCLPTDHSGPHRTSGFYSPASLAPPRCEHNVLLTEPCDACLLAGYERPASLVPEGTPPRYRCMACPLTFTDADSANAHHDATGHHQTHRAHRAFAAPAVRPEGLDGATARDALDAASRAPEGRPPTDWRCSLTFCAVGISHRHPYSPDHPEVVEVYGDDGYAAQRVLWDACPECAGTGLRSRKRCERCQAGFVLVPVRPAVRPEGPEAPGGKCGKCGASWTPSELPCPTPENHAGPVSADDVRAVARFLDQRFAEAVAKRAPVVLSWDDARGFALTLHAAADALAERGTAQPKPSESE